MKTLVKMCHVVVCVVLMAQLTGCGTLMYPERKGQKDGRIDAGVAVLDGLGLLFFIIPGVIAFAVDFSNGTIYLPGTARSSLDLKGIKQAKFDPKHSTLSDIERIIRQETGYTVKLNQDDVKVCRLKSLDDMKRCFAEALPRTSNSRIALNTE